MDALIRPILPTDDRALAAVIHHVLDEFGAGGDGFAGQDAEMASLSAAYAQPGHAYFVVQQHQSIIGGAGVGPLAGGDPTTAELRKMYLSAGARGQGLGHRLLNRVITTSRALGYRHLYLETLTQMQQARRLYAQAGFSQLAEPMGATGHHGCDCWYRLDLISSDVPNA